ncbi:MAG: GyrI-like domain-containing protein [Deferribacteres bacterium]|nr:GyrI-like domain-containing protein [candidate division KSB1 bacterium]MCB9511846.1 GyrI-like domain-containing protein [Deferribacteres bacterium]
MKPKITTIEPRKLVGMHMQMTLADDQTAALWQRFMRRRDEINNRANQLYVSMQIFTEVPDLSFSPDTPFEKWAAVEVTTYHDIPAGMASHTLQGGQYAVFIHRGPAAAYPKTAQFIFGVWLPSSGYQLDEREHFDLMEADYRPDNPNAEEEIWVPIKVI